MGRAWTAALVAVSVAGLVFAGPAALGAERSSPDAVRGSIWLAPNGPDPATYVILGADGALLAIDPYLGYGVGRWQPAGGGVVSSVMVFADVDPGRNTTSPGVATFWWDAAAQDDGETLSGTFTGTLAPADGTVPTVERGSMALTRLHSAPMPPEAIAQAPPDPGWQPVLGPGFDGRGRVDFEPYVPPNHNVNHPDGTSFGFNAWVGPAVGLHWPVDERRGIGTTWFTDRDAGDPPLVGEGEDSVDGTRYTLRYGTSKGYADSGTGTYMRLAADDGSPLAASGSSAWPERSSAWIERHRDAAPSLWIVWADGTLIHIDPRFGTGLGLWQPIGERTATVAIRYNAVYPNHRYSTMPGTADLTGEMAIDEAAGRMTMTYDVTLSGPRKAVAPKGTMIAERIELEPKRNSQCP